MQLERTIIPRWVAVAIALIAVLLATILIAAGDGGLIFGWSLDSTRANIHIAPQEGAPGTTITVNGKGWEAGEPVVIYMDGVVWARAVANGAGTMSVSFVYPRAEEWAGKERVEILARGGRSDRGAKTVWTNGFPAAARTAMP